MALLHTCADIRRLITRGELKNSLLKQHISRCSDCLAFGRKYLKDKKQAEAAGEEMKSDPQVMAAQLLAMNEEKQKARTQLPRWLGVVLGFLVAGLFLLMFI